MTPTLEVPEAELDNNSIGHALRSVVMRRRNEIRVDNVQHNLMAFLKILGAFRAEDYAWP